MSRHFYVFCLTFDLLPRWTENAVALRAWIQGSPFWTRLASNAMESDIPRNVTNYQDNCWVLCAKWKSNYTCAKEDTRSYDNFSESRDVTSRVNHACLEFFAQHSLIDGNANVNDSSAYRWRLSTRFQTWIVQISNSFILTLNFTLFYCFTCNKFDSF